jgi:hypothetical protein
VTERLPKSLHASVRRALRQAWELDDADKAERLLRNLARRLDQEAPGVAASILKGLDEMLTVVRLKLPMPLRRPELDHVMVQSSVGREWDIGIGTRRSSLRTCRGSVAASVVAAAVKLSIGQIWL